VIDDIIVWWISPTEFDVMPNASNTQGVTSALTGVDVTSERCVLAVQGPNARARVATIDERFASVGRFRVERFDVGDTKLASPARVTRARTASRSPLRTTAPPRCSIVSSPPG
jgi:glycine cleavage system aminomethyltransferase T